MSAPTRHLSPVARRVWMLTQLLVWGALTIAAASSSRSTSDAALWSS